MMDWTVEQQIPGLLSRIKCLVVALLFFGNYCSPYGRGLYSIFLSLR